MQGENGHIPVLLAETMTALAPRQGGRYLDGTIGLGGHTRAILESAPGSEVCAIDRDTQALERARRALLSFDGRVHFFHAKFSEFADCLQDLEWSSLDGALLDIGVSSMQLDTEGRGFSFNSDGPLDMRMDGGGDGRSAWHLVNRESFDALRDCIATLGEEPQAGRIARAIVESRQKAPIDTTGQLARLVEQAYPLAWRKKARRHPATRTFQALRMAINDELGELRMFLERILAWLPVGGRLAVITFHSLEDRMVKHAMRNWAEGCRCPAYVPVCTCNHQPEVKILFKKPQQASHEELASNPRASSAKLRAVEKIAGAA